MIGSIPVNIINFGRSWQGLTQEQDEQDGDHRSSAHSHPIMRSTQTNHHLCSRKLASLYPLRTDSRHFKIIRTLPTWSHTCPQLNLSSLTIGTNRNPGSQLSRNPADHKTTRFHPKIVALFTRNQVSHFHPQIPEKTLNTNNYNNCVYCN